MRTDVMVMLTATLVVMLMAPEAEGQWYLRKYKRNPGGTKKNNNHDVKNKILAPKIADKVISRLVGKRSADSEYGILPHEDVPLLLQVLKGCPSLNVPEPTISKADHSASVLKLANKNKSQESCMDSRTNAKSRQEQKKPLPLWLAERGCTSSS